jgi:dihydrolipoamide dehydrogenase
LKIPQVSCLRMAMDNFDLAVIGAGPGGYVAAIHAAKKGMRVICIEKDQSLGGTCLNVGCIPSKALLHSTEYYHRIAHSGKEHGIEFSTLKVNLEAMMERKYKIVSGLTSGISFLFKKYHVHHKLAQAKLVSPTVIQAGDEKVEAKSIILATGSEPTPLPMLPFDEKKVMSSMGVLSLKEIPKKMVMIGAGVIGLELGSVFRRLGTEVEVIELLDRVTPTLDREISKAVEQILKRQGFTFYLNTQMTEVNIEDQRVILKSNQKEVRGDIVLVAIGRRPYTKNLGLETVGIKLDEKGRVVVNQNFQTSVPNIYAIGDLIDGPMLAHKASEEGVAAVDILCGENARVNYLAIANVMYTWPEVACVGMTEEEAKDAHLEILSAKVPFKAIPRARCSGDEEGFVKILGEKNTGKLIGLHIIGPNASEMIHEGVLAIQNKMTLKEISHASHAHPTSSEAIKESALLALGKAIHV